MSWPDKRIIVFVVCLVFSFFLIGGSAPTHKTDLHEVNQFQFFLGEPIKDGWIKAVNQAEDSIHIGMYYAMGDQFSGVGEFYNALLKAKKRGVQIHLGVDMKDRRAFEFFNKHGINANVYSDTKIQHLKGIVVDEKYTFVGSQNITPSALRGKNWSSGVIFKSKPMSEKFARYLKNQQ